MRPISVTGTRRIVRFAMEFVRANGRRKVTLGHKANIMRFSDGLFLSIGQIESESHPDVWFEDMQIDQLSMRLTREPETLDVLLLPNLYGDILSDLCAGLVGGLGLAAGANLGWEYAVFEPVHGSAPDIAGLGVANPVAMILSGAMLLRHLGEHGRAISGRRWTGSGRQGGRTADPGTSSTDGSRRRGRALMPWEPRARPARQHDGTERHSGGYMNANVGDRIVVESRPSAPTREEDPRGGRGEVGDRFRVRWWTATGRSSPSGGSLGSSRASRRRLVGSVVVLVVPGADRPHACQHPVRPDSCLRPENALRGLDGDQAS
jgi:hypothetical protein